MVDGESHVSHYLKGKVQTVREEGKNEPCVNGLELGTSV